MGIFQRRPIVPLSFFGGYISQMSSWLLFRGIFHGYHIILWGIFQERFVCHFSRLNLIVVYLIVNCVVNCVVEQVKVLMITKTRMYSVSKAQFICSQIVNESDSTMTRVLSLYTAEGQKPGARVEKSKNGVKKWMYFFILFSKWSQILNESDKTMTLVLTLFTAERHKPGAE